MAFYKGAGRYLALCSPVLRGVDLVNFGIFTDLAHLEEEQMLGCDVLLDELRNTAAMFSKEISAGNVRNR